MRRRNCWTKMNFNMEVRIEEFEKRAIDAVSELRNLLGATTVDVNVHVDNYEKGCHTDVKFFTSIQVDTSRGGCGPVSKGN